MCCESSFTGKKSNSRVGIFSNYEITNSQIEAKCDAETAGISGDISRDMAYAECVAKAKAQRSQTATNVISTAWDWLTKPKNPVVGPAAGVPAAEESKFPWAAVLGITLGVAAIGGGIYLYNKNKK